MLKLQLILSVLSGGYIMKLGMARKIAEYNNQQKFQDFH